MSREYIKAFFKKIESDDGLRERLRFVARETESEAAAKIVKIAEEAGYPITTAELLKIRYTQLEYHKIFNVNEEEEEEEIGVEKASECCHWAQGCMPGFCAVIEG